MKKSKVDLEEKIHTVSSLLFEAHHRCLHLLIKHGQEYDRPMGLIMEVLEIMNSEMNSEMALHNEETEEQH